MSKRQFKSHASSGRAAGAFGGFGTSSFGASPSSVLSYIQEPPDYSQISDPSAVVALKNLSKKDSTTKAKALEELQSYITSEGHDVEDGVVEAWVKLFPRLSIDNSRRVRQLSFTLNGQLCSKCGKRIAKHLSHIAGPWLAGLHDADRVASKAALEALQAAFPSAEKIEGLKRTFQGAILEYCQTAALEETPQSLSDERTVSPDDAAAVYARVVSTNLAVVSSLLGSLPADELAKQMHAYERLTSDSRLWQLAHHSDATVRRAMHRFIRTCAQTQPELIKNSLKAVSTAYVYKGLPSDQTSSALDFVATLEVLTTVFPTMWTDDYTGKRPAISRLRTCLKNGSHNGTAAFWETLSEVLKKMPADVLPSQADEIVDVLEVARSGASQQSERLNAAAAWTTYITLLELTTVSSSSDTLQKVFDACVAPLVAQYIQPSEATAAWGVPGPKAAALVARALSLQVFEPQTVKVWQEAVDTVIASVRLSQPEQSSNFHASQKAVVATGSRLANVQAELCRLEGDRPSPDLRRAILESSRRLLDTCIDVLKSRNGKPYGAAAIVEEQLKVLGPSRQTDRDLHGRIGKFALEDIPALFVSPAQTHLAKCIHALGSEPFFEDCLERTMNAILNDSEDSDSKLESLGNLFSGNISPAALQRGKDFSALQDFVAAAAGGLKNEDSSRALSKLVASTVVSQQTLDKVLSQWTDSLSITGDATSKTLTAVSQLVRENKTAVKVYMANETESGSHLLPNVLLLEQSADDDVAGKAAALSAQLTSAMDGVSTDAKSGVVLKSLHTVSSESLPMDAVLELVDRLVGEDQTHDELSTLLPDAEKWRESLLAVANVPRLSLSITGPLAGAVHLVKADATTNREAHGHDAAGLSQALRIGMYVAHLLTRAGTRTEVPKQYATELAYLRITALLAEDNLSITGANGLWSRHSARGVEEDIMGFLAEVNDLLRNADEAPSPQSLDPVASVTGQISVLGTGVAPASPMAYYASCAIVRVRSNHFEQRGFSSEQIKTSEDLLKSTRKSQDALALVECLLSYSEPLAGTQTLNRVSNELIADLTAADVSSNPARSLETLVCLNTILGSQESPLSGVAKPRIVFLVKHIISWVSGDVALATKAEVLRLIHFLLPNMADMYGEHWTQVLELILRIWSTPDLVGDDRAISESGVLALNATLKLYAGLERLSGEEEVSDDLLDALKDKRDGLYDSLIGLLKSLGQVSDEHHKPLRMTNELLARKVSRLPNRTLADVEDLFPLMLSTSQAIQGAASELLRKHILEIQEQISFNAALDNKTARLPDELMSLILEKPNIQRNASASSMPTELRGFLLSWRLVFESFTGSSYRVKADYAEQLKEAAVLQSLLDLVIDALGHTSGRPVDISTLQIDSYVLDAESDPTRDLQWLLTYLFYSAMLFLPNLVQSYVRDIRSRQTSQAIETWTAKHISPSIITNSLQAVAAWGASSVEEDPDYENMSVKVGMRSREINVSYVVDEQTMAIKVVLPDTYPLEAAKVVSVNRVAVKEERWQSWLRNCQGVITFSNGSIIDGLAAWRRNVTGALKGQTECAICYSIISGDKQLPTKRCPTCKNLFHSSCLYKWFKTSNASTCPLCRNPFNFN